MKTGGRQNTGTGKQAEMTIAKENCVNQEA